MLQLDRRYRWYACTLKGLDGAPREYIFRGLTQGEVNAAGTYPDEYSAVDYVLNQCVLGGIGEEELAGTATCLFEQINRISGLTEEGVPYKEALEWIEGEEGKYEAIAVAMIAGCTPDVIRNCDPSDRAKFLIMGKFMYETIYGRPVEEAFGKKTSGIEAGIVPQQPIPMTKQGEVGHMVEGGFTWKKS